MRFLKYLLVSYLIALLVCMCVLLLFGLSFEYRLLIGIMIICTGVILYKQDCVLRAIRHDDEEEEEEA